MRVTKLMLKLGDFGLAFGDLLKEAFIGKSRGADGLTKETTSSGDFMFLGGILQESG